ncbi:peptidoglycan-binding protein [Clostridium sp. AM58-1XD]|uniref:C40 family peptidase n=1 Tax=Clostridium sp. AM58-1XD TaxID=2292307 RepID=UPI000E4D611D|nr:peptidoglycan-binding protein [Clostridium sp. AM58-1XD]RGY97371.1 peptidoglycan-binding protein [Clostridium sp. AM58-1XD]
MNINESLKMYLLMGTIAAAACVTAACSGAAAKPEGPIVVTAAPEPEGIIPDIEIIQMTPDGPLFPDLAGVEAGEPIPDYLRIGVHHPIVAKLQERLMELGFMDNDEPTEFYGEVTVGAVKHFQRQNGLPQDGIVGEETLNAILDPEAKYYAVENGVSGDDIQKIQVRLYELGYLASADLVTGNFGDSTEAAVNKLQQVNGLTVDGKVGQKTMNLLYSDEIKPNMIAYGEKSDVVLACQKELRRLGYMTTEPDGAYGNDTTLAVKQFQARNDLVVDGFLGPSTRIALNSPEAVAMGLTLGEQGETVQKVQQLLSKYGYLASTNVTSYYGEVTEKAVKEFQKQNGLIADGLVGAQTMNTLTGDNVKKAPSKPKPTKESTGGKTNNNKGNSGGGSTGGSSGGGGAVVHNGSGVSTLISVARSKVGSPYVWGSKGPNAFDCSGFVYWCLNQSGVRQSYLTSSGWRNVGRYQKITNFGSLQAGDIIVVRGHVGIVAGGGQVIDASSSNGRVVQRSLSSWWANNFICGWRIFG